MRSGSHGKRRTHIAGVHHVAVVCSDDERSRRFPYLVWVGIATVPKLSITWSNW